MSFFFFLFLRGRGRSKAGRWQSSPIPARPHCAIVRNSRANKVVRARTQARRGSALALCFPEILIQLVRSAFTRSFYSYQLLVMVIKYIPGVRHQLLGSGAPQRGLAGRCRGGSLAWPPACLPACLSDCLAALLAAAGEAEEFQVSSVTRPEAVPEESRAGKSCGAWLKGTLAGCASGAAASPGLDE